MALEMLPAAVRTVCFAAALALLPHGLAPWSLRACFAVSCLVFIAPYSDAAGLGPWLSGSALLRGNWSCYQAVVEAVLGLGLAVFLSASAYGARAAGSWFSAAALAPRPSDQALIEVSPGLLQTATVLLSTVLLLETGLFYQLYAALASSLFTAGGEAAAAGLAATGRGALAAAFFIVLPVFAAAFLIDVCTVLVNRFSLALADSGVVRSARLGAVVVVLLLLFFVTSSQLLRLHRAGLSSQRINQGQSGSSPERERAR